jgi:hypothetical protein
VFENTMFRRKYGPNLRESKKLKEGESYIHSTFVNFNYGVYYWGGEA